MDRIKSSIYGVAIGDMIGVPVEHMRREELAHDPVVGPRAHGSYDQPLGAWSDDTSLTLALADALSHDFELKRIAQYFLNWWIKKEYTSHGYVFDIGNQTRLALNTVLKIMEAEDYEALELLHLDASDQTNGNGSLMRIVPLYFYLKDKGIEEHFETIWQVSALTHPHIRSAIACLACLIMLDELGRERATPQSAYTATQRRAKAFFATHEGAQVEASHFARILDGDISQLPLEAIKSSGYVIDTLEASLWSFLRTNSYETAVLTAVNLGNDTDTVGAVTGGFAGFYYGFEAIPATWHDAIANKQLIDQICLNLQQKIEVWLSKCYSLNNVAS